MAIAQSARIRPEHSFVTDALITALPTAIAMRNSISTSPLPELP
jgi:hypothetical protein